MATQFPKTDKEPCSKPEEMTAPVSNMEQKLQEEKQQTENSDQGPVSNPLLPSLAMWPWPSYLTSLGLSFSMDETETVAQTPSHNTHNES